MMRRRISSVWRIYDARLRAARLSGRHDARLRAARLSGRRPLGCRERGPPVCFVIATKKTREIAESKIRFFDFLKQEGREFTTETVRQGEGKGGLRRVCGWFFAHGASPGLPVGFVALAGGGVSVGWLALGWAGARGVMGVRAGDAMRAWGRGLAGRDGGWALGWAVRRWRRRDQKPVVAAGFSGAWREGGRPGARLGLIQAPVAIAPVASAPVASAPVASAAVAAVNWAAISCKLSPARRSSGAARRPGPDSAASIRLRQIRSISSAKRLASSANLAGSGAAGMGACVRGPDGSGGIRGVGGRTT